MRKCLLCVKEFTPKRKDQNCCSSKCGHTLASRRFKSRKRREKKPNTIVKCKLCGEEFAPSRPSHIFCSKKCQQKRFYNGPEKSCKYCGRLGTKHKFCNSVCRRLGIASRNLREREKLRSKLLCCWCGDYFKSKRKGTKFCSDDCSQSFYNYVRRDYTPVEREQRMCIGCGKDFIPTKRNSEFCSRKCWNFVMHSEYTKQRYFKKQYREYTECAQIAHQLLKEKLCEKAKCNESKTGLVGNT